MSSFRLGTAPCSRRPQSSNFDGSASDESEAAKENGVVEAEKATGPGALVFCPAARDFRFAVRWVAKVLRRLALDSAKTAALLACIRPRFSLSKAARLARSALSSATNSSGSGKGGLKVFFPTYQELESFFFWKVYL